MAQPLVPHPQNIRLGIIGMTSGNGHPYSWSAIFNGYDAAAMQALCPYPGIITYLSKEPADNLGIPGAKVTCVYCDRPEDAQTVARAALIPTLVTDPTAMIGTVDAVIIATDIGAQHVERARPLVEAGLPLFIDKPLCDNRQDLHTFSDWIAAGAPILSSSSMRYCKEFTPYHRRTCEFGELRHIHLPMAKYWETYGIHALEAMYPILGPGFTSIRCTGDDDSTVATIRHRNGCVVTIVCRRDMAYSGMMYLHGTQGHTALHSADTYCSFKTQLLAFVSYLRTGIRPFPVEETYELMHLLISGIESKRQGGEEIQL